MEQNDWSTNQQSPYALRALPRFKDFVPLSSIKNRRVAGPYDLSTPPPNLKSSQPKVGNSSTPSA